MSIRLLTIVIGLVEVLVISFILQFFMNVWAAITLGGVFTLVDYYFSVVKGYHFWYWLRKLRGVDI